jgi:hypothetical protein
MLKFEKLSCGQIYENLTFNFKYGLAQEKNHQFYKLTYFIS